MRKLKELQISKVQCKRIDGVRATPRRFREGVEEHATKDYPTRVDSEDVIVMLMRKLTEEHLKRMWADKATDLIKSK